MAVFLGIDIGTSGTKTLAMREDGTILASATAEYPLSSPKPGWSEQNPEDWWEATQTTVKKVLKSGKIKPDDVAGIGLTGQMHGSVFLDKQNDIIPPRSSGTTSGPRTNVPTSKIRSVVEPS